MSREDFQIKSGLPSIYKDDRGGGTLFPHPVLGIVKDNIDPSKNGRIRVYLTNYGGSDPNDSKSWVTVSYMSPWFGATQTTAAPADDGKFLTNSQSYGFWATAPDIGTQVICIFVDGKPNQGYYVGCLPKPGAHHMVPGLSASPNVIPNEVEATTYGGADRLPVTEINTNNPKYVNSTDQQNEPKPIHSYQASILASQGLTRDNVRGVVGSSSMRESPSAVFGMSTPGAPIWEGGYTRAEIKSALKGSDPSKFKIVGRTGGHSLLMDDGELFSGRNQMIRLRSAGGHQITMSDDAQVIFITSSNGKTWVELGPEGTVDIYAENSFNVRTQGDINFHADRDINMHAGRNFNIQAENLNQQTSKNITVRAGADSYYQSVGIHTNKAGGALSLEAGGDASLAGSTTYVNGGKINLNTGQTGTPPKNVPLSTMISHVETQFSQAKGWMYPAENPTMSITSRMPTHQPWALAGRGVDADTSPKVSATSAPSAPVSQATVRAAAQPPQQVTTKQNIMTVPPQQNVPETNISGQTKQAIISQNAVNAAMMSVTEKVAGNVIPGVAGLTLQQLETTGVLKPGASNAVAPLLARGVSFSDATPDGLFTGAMGINNAQMLVANNQAQATIAGMSIDNAGLELISRNIISGKESATEISGVVNAASLVGTNPLSQYLNLQNLSNVSTGIDNFVNSLGDPNAPPYTGDDPIVLARLARSNSAVSGAISSGTVAGLVADKNLVGGGALPTSLSDLKDKVVSGYEYVASGDALNSLKNKITDVLSSDPLAAIKSSAQKAYLVAEASFTNLKSGVPNVLGNARAPSVDSPQQKAANDYDVAVAEKEAATEDFFNARKDYYDNKTPENLALVNEAEARIAAADKKIAASSTAFLGVAGGSVTGLFDTALNTTNGTFSANTLGNAILDGAKSVSSSKLPGSDLARQLVSAESLQAKALQVSGGTPLVATTLNSGANALPGGLGSMVSTLPSFSGRSLSDFSNGLDGFVNSLSDPNAPAYTGDDPIVLARLEGLKGGSPTNQIGAGNASAILGSLKKSGSNVDITLDTSADSIAGAGLVVPPIAATGTGNTIDITAKLGQLLGDSRIPVPTGKPLPPETDMTPEEVDTQVLTKEKALQNLKIEEKNLEILKSGLGRQLPFGDLAIKDAEQRVIKARAAYNNIVNSQA